MTHDEMIATVKAFTEGKPVEYRIIGSDTWIRLKGPFFDFEKLLYRVKPEPKYRPYESAEEFMKDFEKHGGWVKYTVKNEVYCQYMYHVKICENGKMLISGRSAEQLMDELYAKWCDDNSPFGVKVEE